MPSADRIGHIGLSISFFGYSQIQLHQTKAPALFQVPRLSAFLLYSRLFVLRAARLLAESGLPSPAALCRVLRAVITTSLLSPSASLANSDARPKRHFAD